MQTVDSQSNLPEAPQSIRAFFNQRKAGLGDDTWEALAAAQITSPVALMQLEDKAAFIELVGSSDLARVPKVNRLRLLAAMKDADFGK